MIKIGVIGAGHLGKIHIKLLKSLNDRFEVIGFFDTDQENALKVATEYGIRLFDSAEELIGQSDAVDIATPTLSHYQYVINTLKHTKPVFVEKPLANTLEEAQKIVKLAEEAGAIVQVGHVERFNPAFIAARPFINDPKFIESHRLAPFNPRGTDVSVVLDLMIHDIDIVLNLVKSTVKRVSVSGVPVVSETADICNARIEFDNGCVANLTASRISIKKMRKMRLFQKEGYCTIDFDEQKTEIFEIHDNEVAPDAPLKIEVGIGNKQKALIYSSPEILPTNAIMEELKNFYDAITGNIAPEVSVEDGLAAMQLAHEILKKSEKNVLI